MSAVLKKTTSATEMMRPDGTVLIDGLVEDLNLTKADLAAVLGISRDSLSKSARLSTPGTQRKLRDFLEILSRVAPWAGSMPQAFAWFCAQPLPSFGDQTAADLIREGRVDALKAYISRIAVDRHA